MENILKNFGYKENPDNYVWHRKDYGGINYSDGDDVENRISNILNSVSDRSVFSTELKNHCTDWPSSYYLSGVRSNILRPFNQFLTSSASVLEIGAGCGAITRYLGETGASVVAVEGSLRRASIARLRTHELINVTVVADSFSAFETSEQFDVITLIGVLEYANLFIEGENPALNMLAKVRSLLKPTGKLIIAIENQLGLKYFAGAPEDHLAAPMYGIEGRYRSDQPQTFGKKVLKSYLHDTGFDSINFLSPLPDYKFPVSIITERGFSNKVFDSSALLSQSTKSDQQMPALPNFSLELTWPQIVVNDLAMDVANSFLVLAENKTCSLNEDVLAYHYSSDRKPEYCKELLIVKSANNEISTFYNATGRAVESSDKDSLIEFRLPQKQKYTLGELLSCEFVAIVTKDDWTIEQVAEFMGLYINIVLDKIGLLQVDRPSLSESYLVPGWCFDLIPQNIIKCEKDYSIIDQEWVLTRPIALGHLLFRAVLSLINKISKFGLHIHRHPFTRSYFVERAISDAGVKVNRLDFDRYMAFEAEIQASVTGRKVQGFLDWQPDALLNVHNLHSHYLHLISASEKAHNYTNELEAQVAAVSEKTKQYEIELVSQKEQIEFLEDRSKAEKNIISVLEVASEKYLSQIDSLNYLLSEKDSKISSNLEMMRDHEKLHVEGQKIALEKDAKINDLIGFIKDHELRYVESLKILAEKDKKNNELAGSVNRYELLELELQKSLVKKDDELKELKYLFDNAELKFKETHEVLREKDAAINEYMHLINNHELNYGELQKVLVDKDIQLNNSFDVLAEREANVLSLQNSLAESHKVVESLNIEFSKNNSQTAEMSKNWEIRFQQCKSLELDLNKKISEAEEICAQMSKELEVAGATLSANKTELDSLLNINNTLRLELTDLNHSLSYVQNSLSWKITSPFRKAIKLLLG